MHGLLEINTTPSRGLVLIHCTLYPWILGYLKLEYYIIYLQTFADISKTVIDILNKIVYIRYLYCFICWVLSTILKP